MGIQIEANYSKKRKLHVERHLLSALEDAHDSPLDTKAHP